MNKTNKLSLLATAVLAVLPAAYAADNSASLDEVVVSATGFAQDIKEAPASISIVSGRNLQKEPIRDIGDAVSSEPGVDVTKTITGSSQISIRGFDPQYTVILIDGKRQNSSYGIVKNGFDPNGTFMPSVDQIERVEVIRGPASVLYGSEAIGGVVNIITKKNFDKFNGSIGVDALIQEDSRYGNAFSQSANFNLPLIDNKLSLGVHGKNYSNDGSELFSQDGNYARASAGEYDNYTYGALLNYQISDTQRVYVDFDKSFDSGITNNVDSRNRILREWDRVKYSLNYDGSFDSADVYASLAYNSTKLVGSARTAPGGVGPFIEDADLKRLQSEYWIGKLSALTRHDTNLGFFTLNSGLEVTHERFYDGSSIAIADSYAKQNTLALFEEIEYFFTDDLSSTVGVRISETSTYGTSVSPRAYLVYRAADDLTLKAGLATGYKIGSLDQIQSGITSVSNSSSGGSYPYFGNPDLKEERSINYELSAVYSNKNFGNLTLTGFYTSFKNKIETTTFEKDETLYGNKCVINGDGYCSIFDNIAKSHVYGIETVYNSPVFNNFNVDLNYTFTKSEIDDGEKSRIGMSVSDTPRHAVYAKLNYVDNGFSAFVKGTAKIQTPVSSPYKGQDHWYKDVYLVDLGMSYTLNKHTVSFVVSNVLDTKFDSFSYIEKKKRYVLDYKDYIEGRNYYLSYRYTF